MEWLTRQLISDSSNHKFSPHSLPLSKAIFPRRRLDGFFLRQGDFFFFKEVWKWQTEHHTLILFRDGTLSNSRANCSSALCFVFLADGLISINQEKLVDRQLEQWQLIPFLSKAPHPFALRAESFYKLGCKSTEDAGSVAAVFHGMQVRMFSWCRPSLELLSISNILNKFESLTRPWGHQCWL